jgi:hypothetical protein
MKQLSLVAFYGEKGAGLAGLLDPCRSAVARSPLGEFFGAYDTAQVHATLVGMECLPGESQVNRNMWSKRGVKARMDFSRLREALGRWLPMAVRFGGFGPDDRRFESQGRTPYERSFQIHRASGKVTLVGWPHVQGDYEPRLLEQLRVDLSRSCNLEHKYDGDNDLYLVLGVVEPATAAAGSASAIETVVRDHLLRHPIDLRLALADTSIACYVDETLVPSTTRAYALADPAVTPELLEALYAT